MIATLPGLLASALALTVALARSQQNARRTPPVSLTSAVYAVGVSLSRTVETDRPKVGHPLSQGSRVKGTALPVFDAKKVVRPRSAAPSAPVLGRETEAHAAFSTGPRNGVKRDAFTYLAQAIGQRVATSTK